MLSEAVVIFTATGTGTSGGKMNNIDEALKLILMLLADAGDGPCGSARNAGRDGMQPHGSRHGNPT